MHVSAIPACLFWEVVGRHWGNLWKLMGQLAYQQN